MIDVLVLVDANPDLILRGDGVPRFGQAERLLSSVDVAVGGSGATVAHGPARLGRSVLLAAPVGRGCVRGPDDPAARRQLNESRRDDHEPRQ